MTPKEKAKDLINKFQHPFSEESDTDCLHIEVAKEFALIAIDEMIEVVRNACDEELLGIQIIYLLKVKQ